MGKFSRQKGQRGEREWRDWLRDNVGCPEPRRGWQAASKGGGIQSDVEDGIPGTHPEVKRTERIAIWAALAQARHDAECRPGLVPYVAFRRNHGKWVVAVEAEFLIEFAKRLIKECCRNGTEAGRCCTADQGPPSGNQGAECPGCIPPDIRE